MENHKASLKHFILSLALFICAFMQAPTAHADEASEAKQAATLYREGRYDEASVLYARLSVAYPDNMAYLWNLGACYYYSIRADQAISTLRQYLNQDPKATPEEKQMAERWIAEMESRKRSAGAPASGPAPGPLAPTLPPGAAGPGPAPMTPIASDAAVAKRAADEDSSGKVLLLAGVGAAGLLTGVICTAVAMQKFETTEKQYNPDAESSGKTFATLQVVGYGIGLAALTAAAVIHFGQNKTLGETNVAAVTPLLTSSAAGLSYSSRF